MSSILNDWEKFCDELKASGKLITENSDNEVHQLEGFRYKEPYARDHRGKENHLHCHGTSLTNRQHHATQGKASSKLHS